MVKYSYELKLQIVQDYLSGAGGIRFLTNKYSISSVELVRRWVNAYKEFGSTGLQRKRQNASYDSKFKLNAVNLYLTSELSCREVGNKLGVNNRSLITLWVREYRKHGALAFVPKSPGKPRKEVKVSLTKADAPKNKATELEKKLAETQKELLYLKVENEYLKGMRSLRMEQQMRGNPDLFTNSNDNSSSH